MTYNKDVTYSKHAAKRLKERGIRRTEVRWLIAQGEPEPEFIRNPKPHEFCKRGLLGKDEARVLYLEWRRRIHVITVMWVE